MSRRVVERVESRLGTEARALLAGALIAVVVAADASAGEIARGFVSIAGISLEVERREVVTAVDVPSFVQTIFAGQTNEASNAPPGLTAQGELSGPGIETPITLTTRPGYRFELPALHDRGEYTLQNIRLVGASGEVLQQAIPSFASITVTAVLSTTVKVRQLTPDELRARGLHLDANFDVYEYTIVLGIEQRVVEIPYPVIVDRRTHAIVDLPVSQAFQLPPAMPNKPPPPRFQPPTTLPLVLADDPEVTPVSGGNPLQIDKPLPQRPRIPAAIVIPSGFGVLHQFFAVLLQVANSAPIGSEIVLDSITAALDAPLALRVAQTTPAVTAGQPVPLRDGANGASFLIAGAEGVGEWSLEALKAGTHTVEIEVRATYKSPGQPNVPLRGRVSASVVVSDPRFHITFSHPDTIRKDEPYTAYAFVTNLSPQRQTVRLDTTEIPACGQGTFSEICRTEGNGVTELTIEPGAMATAPYKLKPRIDGRIFSTAGTSSDAALGVDVKLTMGVSASGIPLSPATLLMPYYARFLDPSLVEAQLPLLGLGYSLATAPLTKATSAFPRVLRSDVFQRAQQITRAGQRVFIARRAPPAAATNESRDALFQLSLDLLDNVERVDRLTATPELSEWDQLRRLESAGRHSAVAIARAFDAMATGGTMTQFADAFASATSHRAPFLLAMVHGPPVNGATRPYAMTVRGRTSAGILSLPSEEPSGWVRTLPFGELITVNANTKAELALVGRWKESVVLEIVPRTDRFTVELLYPDDAAGAFLRSTFEVTGARPGVAVTIPLSRGNRSIVVSGGSAAPIVQPIQQASLRLEAAAQDLHLDSAGHVVSLLFNRPVSVAAGTQLSDLIALTTRLDSVGYSVTRRNSGGVVYIPGAAAQDDGTIVNVSFDKSLSRNAQYAIEVAGIRDAVSAATITSTVQPRIDNDRPGGILHGRVLGAGDRELEGVPVQLTSGARQFDTTIEHGQFLFEFVERDIDRGITGSYIVSATAEGKVTEARGTVRVPGQVQTITLTFLGRGAASGVVRRPGGGGVSGASVTVASPLFSEFRRATSDSSGRYAVSDLPVGPLTFVASDAQGRTVYATNEIRFSGEAVVQDLEIATTERTGRGTVRVTVRRSDVADARGSLVAGARVGVYASGFGLRDGLTDAAGRIEFTGVPAGPISILAAEFSLTRQSSGVDMNLAADTVVEQTLTLHVPNRQEEAALVVVQGTVTLDDPKAPADRTRDRPVPGAVITLSGFSALTADANGAYVIAGVPASYGGTKSIQVFDPSSGRRGSFQLPTLVSGTNPFSVRLESSKPAGFARMRVRLTGARGEAVTGYRVLVPHVPPIELTEVSTGLYELSNVAVPQAHEVFAVPRDTSGAYGEQFARGAVRVDFDGQIGVTELRLPGLGTLNVSFRVAGQNCDGGACATGPVLLRYPVWDEIEQSPADRERRVDPDPVTGRVTATRVPALQGTSVESLQHPLGHAGATTRLLFEGDVKQVDLLLSSVAEVSGRVLLPDGTTGADGATVRLEGSVANIAAQTSGAAGQFRFPGVAAHQSFRIIAETTRDGVFRTGFVDGRTVAGGPIADLRIILREQSTVEGRVVDASNLPVPLARYWLRELTWPYRTFGTPADPLIADQSGRFAIGNVFAGSFRVTATQPDIQENRGDHQGEIRFENDASQRDVVIVTGAAGTSSVNVVVENPQDAFRRVANAEVSLLRNGSSFDFATTDANGIAIFERIPTEGSFVARAFSRSTGRGGSTASFSLVRDAVATQVIALDLRGRVAGSVRDPESVPAGGAVRSAPVTLRQGGFFATRASTDASGNFEFAGIPEGSFSVDAIEPESARRTQTETGILSKLVPERTGVTLELERTAQLRVQVHLPNDAGAAGLLAPLTAITVTQGIKGDLYFRELQGNDLTFPKLFARESYSVTARELGGEGRVATVSGSFAGGATSGTARLVFSTSGTVAVAVVDASAQPVADARVTIAGAGRSATLFTPASGQVTLPGFALGPVTVQASKGSVAASASGQLASATTPLAFTLSLGATTAVSGGVDAEASGPSAGTRVVLAATSRLLTGTLTLETRTDGNGLWRFDSIPVGGTNLSLSFLGPDDVTVGARLSRNVPDTQTGELNVGRVRLDATAPRIVAFDPSNNANDVPPNSVVAVVFSEPLDPAALTTEVFQLAATDDGAVVRSATITSETATDGRFTVRIAAPDPTAAQIAAGQRFRLRSNVVYRLTIPAGVRDLTGNAMATTVGISFTTVNYTEPSVVAVVPPVDVPLPQQATFRIRYNKAIDDASFLPGNGGVVKVEKLDAPRGNVVAELSLSVFRDPADARTLVVAPAGQAIAESSFYRLTVSGTRDTQSPPNVQSIPRSFEYSSFDTKVPIVSIQSPVPDGFDLIAGVSYAVVPSITESGVGAPSTDVAHVDWFDGSGNLLVRKAAAPFAYVFTAPGAPAEVTLRASARDLSGNQSEMASRTWRVTPNNAPSGVTLTPVSSELYPGATTSATVRFGDEGLAVTVTLRLDGTSRDGSAFSQFVGSRQATRASLAAPWNPVDFAFTLPLTLKEGTATLTATVTDAASQASTRTEPLTILTDATAPRVISLAPAPETRYRAGDSLVIQFKTSDAETGIARAEIGVGNGTPVTIATGQSGSSFDAATGIWTFTRTITVPARNADTRIRITAKAFDGRDNQSSTFAEVIYERVDDPAVPRAAWVTPLDGAVLPRDQAGWLAKLRVKATGNITQVVFSSPAMAAPAIVTAPKSGTTDVYETSAALSLPVDGSVVGLTATFHDGVESHVVELPIAIEAAKADLEVTSGDFAITTALAETWKDKRVLVRGSGTRLSINAPLVLKDLMVIDGSAVTSPEELKLDLTVTDRLFVDGDSSIDVSGKGFAGAWVTRDNGSQNASARGATVGGAGNGALGSASHAGAGGETAASPTNATYGSIAAPSEFGSGGGGSATCCSVRGANGGGAVLLRGGSEAEQPGRFVVAGTIRADGASGVGRGGAGSGGSLEVQSRALITGPGTRLAVNGGDDDGAANETRGGGGGRVAVSAGERFDFDDLSALFEARGGRNDDPHDDRHYADGGAGTIFLRRPGAVTGTLRISSFDPRHPLSQHATRPTPLGGTLTFDTIVLGPRALARFDSAYAAQAVTIDPTAVLVAPGDAPQLSVVSSSPAAGAGIIQFTNLAIASDSGSAEGIASLALISSFAPDVVLRLGDYPLTASRQQTVLVPHDAATGTASAKLRAVSRAGRVTETAPLDFRIVANTAPSIVRFDPTPATEMYAGHTLTVTGAATDDVEVKSLDLATTGGTLTAANATVDPATRTRSQQVTITIPPDFVPNPIQLTLSASDGFPSRAATTQTKTFTILHDTVAPSVSVALPQPNQEVQEGTGQTFAVEATIADAEVSVKRATVTFEGATRDLVPVTGRPNVYGATLAVPAVDGTSPVAKIVTVSATDYENNTRNVSVTILVKPLVDPNAPSLSWGCNYGALLFPAGGQSRVRVMALPASPSNGVQSVQIRIGEPAAAFNASPVAGITNAWEATATFPAAAGDVGVLVRAVATSVAGNISEISMTAPSAPGAMITTNTTLAASDTTHANATLFVGAKLTVAGHHDFKRLVVLDGGTVTQPPTVAGTERVDVAADSVLLFCSGAIDVTATGYGQGLTHGGATAAPQDGGGSHIGLGSVYQVQGSPTSFGSVLRPLEPGGGAGTSFSGGTPGIGGGVVRIATTSLVAEGAIRANGQGGNGGGDHSGAGGSIWITATSLSGSGVIEARAGDDPNGYAGGGGGAIAIELASVSTAAVLGNTTARGGNGYQSRFGGAGTILVRAPATNFGELTVDNGTLASTPKTSLPSLGGGFAQSGSSAATLVTDRALNIPASFAGHWVEIATAAGVPKGTWRIATVTPNSKTATLAPNGSETIAIEPGDRWQGVYRFDSVRGHGTVVGSDPIRIGASGVNGPVNLAGPVAAGRLLALASPIAGTDVTLGGNLTTGAVIASGSLGVTSGLITADSITSGAATLESGVTLTTASITASSLRLRSGSIVRNLTPGPQPLQVNVSGALNVDAGGAIDVSARGYGQGQSYPGASLPGANTGGSHLGLGGVYNVPPAGSTFGSVERPQEAGGGTGTNVNGGTPGIGGGVVRIVAGSLTVDGAIRANGEGGTGGADHSGAGGSVWITTGTLAGAGSVEARGGDIPNGYGPGGGGAISLEYGSGSPAVLSNLLARGGIGPGSLSGGPGTVTGRPSSATLGSLTIDNKGRLAQDTVLPSLGSGVAQSGTTGATLVTDRSASIPPYFIGHWVEVSDTSNVVKGTWRIGAIAANGKTVTLAPNASESISLVPGDKWRGVYRFDKLTLRFAKLKSVDRVDRNTTDSDGVSTIQSAFAAVSSAARSPISDLQSPIDDPMINSLTFAESIASGSEIEAMVTLTSPAPAGGAIVHLVSSSPSLTVPVSVLVAEGSNSGTFVMRAGVIDVAEEAAISARCNAIVERQLAILPRRRE